MDEEIFDDDSNKNYNKESGVEYIQGVYVFIRFVSIFLVSLREIDRNKWIFFIWVE